MPYAPAALLVAGANGSAPREIATTTYPPVWSPRGDVLAYGTSNAVAVRRATGSLIRSFLGFAMPAWGPDGRELAAFGGSSTSDTTNVEILSLSGRRPRIVMGGYALAGLSWSPDGRRLALFATRQNSWALVVRDATTGHLLRRLFVGQHSAPPMWSANGTTIYIGG
jgi:Tol biopolymer transport system component